MGRKMKAFGLEALKIVDINAKGMGVGKDEGRVFFVPGTVPGDVVSATAYRKRRGYWEARLEKIKISAMTDPDRKIGPDGTGFDLRTKESF